ncbi:YkgJ family cysteine cluster protein [Desulforudis sp. 1088]|uniref:YkgJ family cysteine cluster protein n=1 Tax=unclassified Candidatus Desulforudis TaxID=2635950 RepID=UPI003CE48E0C
MLDELFARYEQLGLAADLAFERMQREYADAVKCERGCTDCCHALFGLFPVEAAYLKDRFDKLDPSLQQEILQRADEAEERLKQLQEKLNDAFSDDPEMQSYAMARERVRCPLLSDEGDCALYPFRPVTCRVYGIPTTVQGVGRACWKAAFAPGRPYPAFNLDRLHRELYQMSQSLLQKDGEDDLDRAALLIPVAAALKTPLESLLRGEFVPE